MAYRVLTAICLVIAGGVVLLGCSGGQSVVQTGSEAHPQALTGTDTANQTPVSRLNYEPVWWATD